MLLIQNIEKIRIANFNHNKSKSFIKSVLFVTGDYVIIWYVNREKLKGLMRFQFSKGICMNMQYHGYNSLFQIRSVISGVAIEQQFFIYSIFNLLVSSKKNPIPKHYRNCLKYFRGKKNFISKFKLAIKMLL